MTRAPLNGAVTEVSSAERRGAPGSKMLGLTREECLRLLATTELGRVVLAVTGWEQPVIRPVNYVFDESSQSVLVRSAPGSKLHALLRSATATFEIDGSDPAARTGWSVIVSGLSEEVTNPADLRRIEALGLDSWAPGHKDHWIRIRANTVSGRRISIGSEPG